MKQNLADIVEAHILKLLRSQTNGQIEIQRGDVANALSCAPSQVTYVLSTRFTPERGYVVESRRGLGGFIRISIVPVKSLIFGDILNDLDDANIHYIKEGLLTVYKMQYITEREYQIMLVFVDSIFASKTLAANERLKIFRTMFLALERV